MARTVRDSNLETRAARLRLTPRRKPYWRALEGGFHLGYRRTKTGGGTWTARRFLGEHRYSETSLGVADDLQGADGVAVLDFRQAQEKARGVWKAAERAEQGVAPETGPYTVAAALSDYFDARERRGSKGASADRFAANARIVPALGALEVGKTTTKRIRDWHTGLASAAKLVRTKASADKRATKALDAKDPEAVRARRSTANRILTILKAALNYAFHEGRVASDEAWRKVKPFREVDAPVIRFLTSDETVRLANAAELPFRELVRGALLTGCRYGELTRMKNGDFNPEVGVVTVRTSKAGKPRHVVLTDEGQRLFAALCAGRAGSELIFRRDGDKAWQASEQQRPLEEACRRAKIDPPATFHVLRHTYASSLAMKGVPMGVIAAQLGHSDTRMTEKHYAHLAPSYIADTIRAALPDSGIVGASNVVTLAAKAANGGARSGYGNMTGEGREDDWQEPEFDTSFGAFGQNVRDAQQWLERALTEAARRYHFELTAALRKKFFLIPLSVREFAVGPRSSNEGAFGREAGAAMDWPFAKDAAAALAEFSLNLPAGTKWEVLSKAQRRKGKDWLEFIQSPTRDARKGRPIETDIPLLLYLMFLIEETIGREIPVSRRKEIVDGSFHGEERQPPAGEAFALLRAAYSQASARLDVEPSKPETVYKLVRVAGGPAFRKRFEALMQRYIEAELLPDDATRADFVAAQPSECRLLLSNSRRNA